MLKCFMNFPISFFSVFTAQWWLCKCHFQLLIFDPWFMEKIQIWPLNVLLALFQPLKPLKIITYILKYTNIWKIILSHMFKGPGMKWKADWLITEKPAETGRSRVTAEPHFLCRRSIRCTVEGALRGDVGGLEERRAPGWGHIMFLRTLNHTWFLQKPQAFKGKI